MQKKSDMYGLLDPERTPEQGDNNGSGCGAFNFTSPPDRLLLSDNTNQ